MVAAANLIVNNLITVFLFGVVFLFFLWVFLNEPFPDRNIVLSEHTTFFLPRLLVMHVVFQNRQTGVVVLR